MFLLTQCIGLALILLSTQSYSYVLQNYFYITNLCNYSVEINYKICTAKKVSGKESTYCDDFFTTLDSLKSKEFEVDNKDNYYQDKDNWLLRTIYVYQAISNQSMGLYLIDQEDEKDFTKDHRTIAKQGDVTYCIPKRTHSIILDDFGTDRIYCN